MNFIIATGVVGLLTVSATGLAGGGGEPDYPLRSTYRCASVDSEATIDLKFLGGTEIAYGRADSIGGNLHKQLGFTAYYVEPTGLSSTDSLTYTVVVNERHQAKVNLVVHLERASGLIYQGNLVGEWDGESIDKAILCRLSSN